MDIAEMRLLVRRDLKDEDESNYRWTDDELDRAITRAVREFSLAHPQEMKDTLATVNGSRDVDISTIIDRISIERVEFPVDEEPRHYQRFEVYQNTLTFLIVEGDGNNCYVYSSALHTLDDKESTIPTKFEDLIALGAAAFAAISWSQYATNKANYGGEDVDREYKSWGEARLREFKQSCKKASSKLRTNIIRYEE